MRVVFLAHPRARGRPRVRPRGRRRAFVSESTPHRRWDVYFRVSSLATRPFVLQTWTRARDTSRRHVDPAAPVRRALRRVGLRRGLLGTQRRDRYIHRASRDAFPRPRTFSPSPSRASSPSALSSPETWHPPKTPTLVRRVLSYPRARGPPRRSEQPMGPARSRDILFRRDQGASLAQVSKTRVARGRSGGRRRPESRVCDSAPRGDLERVAFRRGIDRGRASPRASRRARSRATHRHRPRRGSLSRLRRVPFRGRVRSHLSHGRFQT